MSRNIADVVIRAERNQSVQSTSPDYAQETDSSYALVYNGICRGYYNLRPEPRSQDFESLDIGFHNAVAFNNILQNFVTPPGNYVIEGGVHDSVTYWGDPVHKQGNLTSSDVEMCLIVLYQVH